MGIKRRTLYNWVRDGKVEYTRSERGVIMIFVDTLWRAGTPTNLPVTEFVASRETLSVNQSVDVANVSLRTIWNWISAGKVEYVRNAGGSVRIFVDSLWSTRNAMKWSAAGVNAGQDVAPRLVEAT